MHTSSTVISEPLPAVEFKCERCSKVITICRSCWRNQRYCSDVCARESSLERHRLNQKAYSLTKAGRESQRERQKLYRLRQRNRY